MIFFKNSSFNGLIQISGNTASYHHRRNLSIKFRILSNWFKICSFHFYGICLLCFFCIPWKAISALSHHIVRQLRSLSGHRAALRICEFFNIVNISLLKGLPCNGRGPAAKLRWIWKTARTTQTLERQVFARGSHPTQSQPTTPPHNVFDKSFK